MAKSRAERPRKRKPVKGATRNRAPRASVPRSFAWVNHLLVLLGVGVVLAALAKGAMVLHALPVERIVVTGQLEKTQTVAVQEMVQPALDGGFLSADLQRIREQLESLPWVYEANVKRRWPSTLEIRVAEQLPIARWGDKGYLNHAGDIFQSASAANEGLSMPLLSGPRGAQRRLIGDYQLLSEMLGPLGLSVAALSVDARGQRQARLTGGIELALGDSDLRERLERFLALYRSALEVRKGEIKRVDLRYEQGVAVAFHEPAQPVQAVAGL